MFLIFFVPDGICTFIFRVEEYITFGKDKDIVDPEPNGLYTKKKQQRARGGVSSSQNPATTDPVASPDPVSQVHVKYPKVDGGIHWQKCPCLLGVKWTNILQNREKISETKITIPSQQHFERRRLFLKMNIFMKFRQPVISNVFILGQSAVKAAEKTTRRTS